MERRITAAIVRSFTDKLLDSVSLDVAIVGAGPSGLVCASELASKGLKVAIFERRLAPGGGIWGGGMHFNEIVFQEELVPLLERFGIRHRPSSEAGLVCADAVEVASALVYRAVHHGARLFNAATVEDVVFHSGRVAGVVVNWSTTLASGLPVDPLVFEARAVLDATGHDAQLTAKVASKAGIRLRTETGGVMGERPMWAERGEEATVEGTGEVFPGLFVSGMAACGVHGGFRMGPIFGGMLRSGLKAAELIHQAIAGSNA